MGQEQKLDPGKSRLGAMCRGMLSVLYEAKSRHFLWGPYGEMPVVREQRGSVVPWSPTTSCFGLPHPSHFPHSSADELHWLGLATA